MTAPAFAPIGHFCWPELATTDLAAAKAYHAALFGWTCQDMPTAVGTYTVFKKDGLDVAGAYQMPPGHEVPPHWNSYVKVASADAACVKAVELGAKLLSGPFDVAQVGRMGFFEDPFGARLALWESKEHEGAAAFGAPGTLCWTELGTRNTSGSRDFYAALFGWRAVTKPACGEPYTEFYLGDAAVGGMMALEGPEMAEVPPAWLPYIAVGDLAAAVASVQGQGGALLLPPTEVPEVGRFAVARDPQGAVLSLIQLTAG